MLNITAVIHVIFRTFGGVSCHCRSSDIIPNHTTHEQRMLHAPLMTLWFSYQRLSVRRNRTNDATSHCKRMLTVKRNRTNDAASLCKRMLTVRRNRTNDVSE